MSQKPTAKAIQARFPGSEFAQIENWRRAQPEIPPLAEALRTLVKRGLGAAAGRDQNGTSGTKGQAEADIASIIDKFDPREK
jgi:hypothetical protein